jgi:hypothetical protein
MPSTYTAPAAAALKTTAAPSSSSYAALRSIAALCRLIGWAMVGLAALQALAGLVVLFNDFLPGLGVIVVAAVMGAIGYVFWNVLAESILVILDIEANTRRTADLLAQRNLANRSPRWRNDYARKNGHRRGDEDG